MVAFAFNVFDVLPTELKERKQFFLYKLQDRGDGTGKKSKVPLSAHHPHWKADVRDSSKYGTYTEACMALFAGKADGIGFALTESDPFTFIDIDEEPKGISAAERALRDSWISKLEALPTYKEWSQSGKGWHVLVKGRVPRGVNSRRLGIEVYSQDRFFAKTGRPKEDCPSTILEAQNVIDALYSDLERVAPPRGPSSEFLPPDTEESGRSIDLTDEELFDKIRGYESSGTFLRRYNAEEKNGQGEWSDTHFYLVGMLDQFSGKSDQVRRLMDASPFVLRSPANASGEPRTRKHARTFKELYWKARAWNDSSYRRMKDGEKSAEAIMKKFKKVEEVAPSLSKDATELFNAFPLDDQFKKLSVPPGAMGRFVEANLNGVRQPFLKFAIPSTLAHIAGICGRGYKIGRYGEGVNQTFLIAAESATGKTMHANAWKRFEQQAIDSLSSNNGLSIPVKGRIISSGTSSIQAIMPEFREHPSCVWVNDECASVLQKLTDPKNNVDFQLKDSMQEVYDSSSLFGRFTPPRSVSQKKMENHEPIPNFSLSGYWTTTLSNFDVGTRDAEDGFLSRVTVVRHKGSAGSKVDEETLEQSLPEELIQTLAFLYQNANNIDLIYAHSVGRNPADEATAKGCLRGVEFAPETVPFIKAIEKQTDAFTRKAQDGDIPKAYISVARLSVNAKRIASLLAIVENPYAPRVTVEQYQWAFGYVLQCLVELLSDLDHGELGEEASNEIAAVRRMWKKIATSAKFKKKELPGVPRTELSEKVAKEKAFRKYGKHSDAYGAAKKVIQNMMDDGMFECITKSATGVGRPTQHLVLVDLTGD